MTLDDRLEQLADRNQELLACPYPLFADMRAEEPVRWSDAIGAWTVTRYEDVRAVLSDSERFSSAMPTGPVPFTRQLGPALEQIASEPDMAEHLAELTSKPPAAALLNADPPEHVRQRLAVNRAFRPARLRAMEPTIEALSRELVAPFADRGHVEFVHEFAVGLPMRIIASTLGVDDDDMGRFKQWSDDLVMPVGNPNPTVDQVRAYLIANTEFTAYFSDLIARRQVDPADDVISDVANAEVDGEPLTLAEQLSMLTQFLVAGNETTTKLLTNMVFHMAANPELQDRIREDRSLIEGYVEEALRFEAPVGGLFRRAKVDVDVGGVTIPAGDHVWVVYASANRDGEHFAEPDELDPCRANARDHLSFGHGEHFCIGAGLARTEARLGIGVVLDELHDIRLAEHNQVEFEDSFVLRGMKRLDLTFTPASAAGG